MEYSSENQRRMLSSRVSRALYVFSRAQTVNDKLMESVKSRQRDLTRQSVAKHLKEHQNLSVAR